MAKKRQSAKSTPKKTRKGRTTKTAGRVFVAGTTMTRGTLTIAFGTTAELRRKLRRVLDALEPGVSRAPTGREAAAMAVTAAEPCLDTVGATEVVIEALEGKPFEPQLALEETYLSPLERDLFRDRVVSAVEARGCRIGLADVPNGGATMEVEVRDAVEANAR